MIQRRPRPCAKYSVSVALVPVSVCEAVENQLKNLTVQEATRDNKIALRLKDTMQCDGNEKEFQKLYILFIRLESRQSLWNSVPLIL